MQEVDADFPLSQSHGGEKEEELRGFLGWVVNVQRTEYFQVSLGKYGASLGDYTLSNNGENI